MTDRYDQELEVEIYDQAIALNPGDAGAYFQRGIALHHLDRYEQALASYDQAIALIPDNAHAFFNRGIVLNNLGRHEEALASFDQAIALDPDDADAYLQQGKLLYDMRRYEECCASFDQAVARDPKYAPLLFSRGLMMGHLGRHDEALASFDKYIAFHPEEADTYTNRGVALGKLGRHEEALTSYNHAIELDSNDVRAWFYRGEPFLHRLDWDAYYETTVQGFKIANTTDAGTTDAERGDTTTCNEIMLAVGLPDEPEKLTALAELYTENDALPQLGEGITESIPALFATEISQERAEEWLASWQAAGAGKAELNTPLQLLAAAVAWKANPNTPVLLTLPTEERHTLESLLPKPA